MSQIRRERPPTVLTNNRTSHVARCALRTARREGICTGEWMSNITLYDQLRVPAHLPSGDYVLGFRWDCESSGESD